jgi:polysaccharide pyruvyl transferase WcaK-like protein
MRVGRVRGVTDPLKTGQLKVLLVGYSGANNTGAEALLQADIADLRAVLGEDALLTIPALKDASNLRRYLQEGPNLRIVQMPAIFVSAARRLVREHDLVMLVEGSAYMDTWTSALLWYFLWATRCAHAAGRPCLAYAVDAGQLRPLNRWLVKREGSNTDLIITRSAAAAERLRSWGVTAPIESTADNAFTFGPDPKDEAWLDAVWPDRGSGAVGLAAVDFYLWPVVIRPWGRREDCYRWPYYFSRSGGRRRASGALAEGYARWADDVVARHGRAVTLICMEELDEPLARSIHGLMTRRDRARVFSSREHDASRMTALLRSLGLLVTSRYHASVLSLAAHVPQVAVGHDLRLRTLYAELGLEEEFFVGPETGDMFGALARRVDRLIERPGVTAARLREGYEQHAAAARRNRELLRAFVADRGGNALPWAA